MSDADRKSDEAQYECDYCEDAGRINGPEDTRLPCPWCPRGDAEQNKDLAEIRDSGIYDEEAPSDTNNAAIARGEREERT